jgi:hypothetical protein
MELGLLARLLIWLLNRCPSISFIQLDSSQSSPPSRPMVSALDPDILSADLKDPHLRTYYIEFLEGCLTMPASRYKR